MTEYINKLKGHSFKWYLGKLLYFIGLQYWKFIIIYYKFNPFKKDLKQTIGDRMDKIMQDSDPDLFAVTSPDNVYQLAQKQNRSILLEVIKEKLLPGSGLEGVENFIQLHDHAKRGKSTVILSSHFSNFDVPALYTLFAEHNPEMVKHFDDIIFIAGRKLTEGCKYVKALSEIFSRLVISAKSSKMTEQDIKLAMAINKSAQKKMNKLKNQGHIFVVYPTGTRCRPLIPKTHRGLREIYNYLRKFDYFLCLGMSGNCMPTSDESSMIHEYPKKGKLIYKFGEVRDTDSFIKQHEQDLFEGIDNKQYIIDRVMNEIYSLGNDPRKNKLLSIKNWGEK